MLPMRTLQSSLVALAMATLVGCAATYVPPAGSKTATLTMRRGDSPSLSSHAVHFGIYADGACQKPLGTMGNISFLTPEPKVIQVAAGSTVYLRALSLGTEFGSNVQRRCVNVVAFNPQPGAAYDLTHHLETGRCRIDATSPASQGGSAFAPTAVTGSCRP